MVLLYQTAALPRRRWADKVRMPNPEQTNPCDVAVVALKQACQLGRADRQLPRANEQVSSLEPDSARHPSELHKRLAVPPHRSSLGRLALQGLIGVLVTGCIGASGMVLRSHGDAGKQVTARSEPQLYLISPPTAESPVPAQLSPSAVQASASKAASLQSVPPAQTLLVGSAPTVAGTSPEPEQLPQLLRGFLAVVEQDIGELKTSIEQLKAAQEQMVRDNAAVAEQLKATQEQMARDNAAVAEQLKATQEQMTRLIAKASEQQPGPRISAPSPRSIATPTGKPLPKLSSPQARAQPLAPVQGRPK
jgi:outer membrane murein-binding lipoprotein Lpp